MSPTKVEKINIPVGEFALYLHSIETALEAPMIGFTVFTCISANLLGTTVSFYSAKHNWIQ